MLVFAREVTYAYPFIYVYTYNYILLSTNVEIFV